MKNFIKTKLKENLNKYQEQPYYLNLINKDNQQKKAVGVLIKNINTNQVLLLLRNDQIPKWSLMSGNIEDDETPIQTIKREIIEELKINPDIIQYSKNKIEKDPQTNTTFYYYQGFTTQNFIPTLNDENITYGWFNKDNLPNPLYDGMMEKIQKI